MVMNKETVVTRLKVNWTLQNFGSGWHLYEPRLPYIATQSIKIPNTLIEELQTAGLIKLKELSRSMVATLNKGD